jgi:uncharacterized membrane protein YfcA
MTSNIVFILSGLMSGLISRLTGVGNTFVLFTIFFYFDLIELAKIQGTISFALLLPVLISIYNNYNSGNINFYVGTVSSICMVLGGIVGSKILLSLKENSRLFSKRLGGLILIICGIMILTK